MGKKAYYGSLSTIPTFFRISVFVLSRRRKLIQVWNNFRTKNNNSMKATRCLKLVSVFYTFLIFSGGVIAGFGIWSQITKKTSGVLETVDDTTLVMILSQGAPALIALGCILALMGLIGFCSILKKKSWMLLVFFFVVLIIFILQVIVAVFSLLPNLLKENVLSSLEVKVVESLQKKYKQDSSITDIWDEAMNKLKCCGYKSYDDFTDSIFVKEKFNYPIQCCGKDSKTDSNSECGKAEALNKTVKGCIHVLLAEIVPASGSLSFLIGILEIFALFVSLKVYRCLKRLPDVPDPFEMNQS